jgi:hypothetical protein
MPSPVPNSWKIAERLLAHARLCRQIAEETSSEEVAAKLSELADKCARAAADIDPEPEDHRPQTR